MGLDMYLYKVVTPRIDNSKIIDKETIFDMDVFPLNYFKNSKMYSKAILMNGLITNVRYSYYDQKKLLSDFGFDSFHILHLSEEMTDKILRDEKFIYFDVYKGTSHLGQEFCKKIEIEKDLFFNEYVTEEIKKEVLVELEELCYQRKGLTDEGWNLIPRNCSYCDDKEIIKKMVEVGGLDKKFIDLWEDGKTVFHPWW